MTISRVKVCLFRMEGDRYRRDEPQRTGHTWYHREEVLDSLPEYSAVHPPSHPLPQQKAASLVHGSSTPTAQRFSVENFSNNNSE